LKSIIAARPSNYEEVLKIIYAGLTHKDIHSVCESLKCFTLYLKAKDGKTMKNDKAEDLARNICQCVIRLIDEKEDKIGL
jgi:hypothetical protein